MTQVEQILAATHYATLSTVDKHGQPWAAPVHYAFDGIDTFYWWSSTTSQHSRNIEQNSNVYITIFDSAAPEGTAVGLYVRAQAGLVGDDELDRGMEQYNATTDHFKLSRQNTTGEAPYRLYQAKLSTMQVNGGAEIDGYHQDIRRDVL